MALGAFRRNGITALGLALGIAAGRIGYPAAALTRLMLAGLRQPLWRSPVTLGLEAEDVVFGASDGVILRGWFLHRAGDTGQPAPAIVFVHGWPWNRLGNRAGQTLLPDRDVDFLNLAQALGQAGFHTLLFDLRNHGQSDAAMPVTFGVHEARDFIGAVSWLRRRRDVDSARIGAIGFSMGANTLIYGIPRSQPIRAAVAVQPTTPTVFAPRLTQSIIGPAGPAMVQLAEPLYRALGGPPLAQINLVRAAEHLRETKMLYIQGSGDQWGTVADVQAIAWATPNALPLVIHPSTERFGGYLYADEHRERVVSFFEEHLR